MRKKVTILILLATLVWLPLSAAQAALLFDTGTPSDIGRLQFGSSTQYAGKVSVPEGGWQITGLEAYLVNNETSILYANVRIYAEGATIPGSPLVTLGFSIPADNPGPAWFGRTDLDVELAAGTYWFGLIWAGGSAGGLPYSAPNVPDQFEAQAVYYSGLWTAADNLDFGYRITGVPIPGAVWLLGTGLLGLLGARRMKKG